MGRLEKIYKITEKEQSKKCGICQRPFSKFKKFQDHFHGCCDPKKKKEYCGKCTRGTLCYLCNRFITGYIEKKKIPWNRVAEYLNKWEGILLSRGVVMSIGDYEGF
jgi:hypothetical protein